MSTEKDTGQFALRAGTYKLPFGSLVVNINPEELRCGPLLMEDFVPVYELDACGFGNDYRWTGVEAINRHLSSQNYL